MLRAFAEAKRRRLISRSTEYCREDAPMGLGGDCYASFQRDKNTLPACSLANQGAGKACLCPAGAKKELRGCDLESGPPGSAGYKIAHCAERVEYVARGAESGPSVWLCTAFLNSSKSTDPFASVSRRLNDFLRSRLCSLDPPNAFIIFTFRVSLFPFL